MVFQVPEQTVNDRASGLILRFWVDSQGFSRLAIYSEHLPFRNRELGFEKDEPGVAFSGTHIWEQPDDDSH